MSAADQLATETVNAATALAAAQAALVTLTADDILHDPAALARALVWLQRASERIELLLHRLHQRTTRAAQQDTDSAAARDRLTTLAGGLSLARARAHRSLLALHSLDGQAAALTTAARRGTRGALGTWHLAQHVVTAAALLGQALALLEGGLAIGGHPIALPAATAADTIEAVQEVARRIWNILRTLHSRIDDWAVSESRPQPVAEQAHTLSADLTRAVDAAQALHQALGLLDLRTAAPAAL